MASDDEYREEIAEHLELETQANIDRGMTPEEARRAARAAFGSVASVRQRLYEGRGASWLLDLARDAAYGVRMIRRHALLCTVVVLTMSVGIGSAAAVFSIVNRVAFVPPVTHDPGSFVQFARDDGSIHGLASLERYESLRLESRTVRDLAAWSSLSGSATLGSMGREVAGDLVTCNLFSVFSVPPPLAGRLLQPADCAAAAPVAVMSDRLWRARFAGDPGIVGRSMTYGRQMITIVGVAVPPEMVTVSPDLWLPHSLREAFADLFPNQEDPARGTDEWLSLAGRLAPGYSRRDASAEFRVLTRRESQNDPLRAGLQATDGSMWSLAPAETSAALILAMIIPMLVVSIVCATAATLLLSRAVKRQHEIAVRLALGGSRFRLVRMLLVENLLLAGLAAVLSLWVVHWLPLVIVRRMRVATPEDFLIQPDWRVFTCLGAMALITAIGAGIAPALESLNVRIGESLNGRSMFGRRGVARTHRLLIGVQAACGMVPLVATMVFVRAEYGLSDPGFEARQVLHAFISDRSAARETLPSLAGRVKGLPGVRAVAYADVLPPIDDDEGALVVEGNGVLRRSFPSSSISPDYFRVLDLSILSGRGFREDDAARSAGHVPIVVSQQFAQRVFPGQDALGQVLHAPVEDRRLEIIGVVADRATGSPSRANRAPVIYRLMEPRPVTVLLVRYDGDAARFAPALQQALQAATGSFIGASTIQSSLDSRVRRITGIRTVVMSLAAAGLVLALAGIFGILAFTAARSRKEVAIRAALGATRREIAATMVVPALRPIVWGIVAGSVLSFAGLTFAEYVRAFPWELGTRDPAAYLLGGAFVLGAALAAMILPAWRATLSDPARALRED